MEAELTEPGNVYPLRIARCHSPAFPDCVPDSRLHKHVLVPVLARGDGGTREKIKNPLGINVEIRKTKCRVADGDYVSGDY